MIDTFWSTNIVLALVVPTKYLIENLMGAVVVKIFSKTKCSQLLALAFLFALTSQKCFMYAFALSLNCFFFSFSSRYIILKYIVREEQLAVF